MENNLNKINNSINFSERNNILNNLGNYNKELIKIILENKNIESFFDYIKKNSVNIDEINKSVSHINPGIYIKTELSSENKELYYDNSDIKLKTSIIDRDQFETFLNNFRKG